MEDHTNWIVIIIGYIVAILIPIIGLIYAAVLYFSKKEVDSYRKHAVYIAIVALVVWLISALFINSFYLW